MIGEELWARLRGGWLRHKLYLLSLGRVRIGPGFKAYGTLHTIGLGHIRIGRDLTVRPDVFGCRDVSLQTQGSREAVIEIGDRVTLLGTHVSCGRHVAIGDDAWIEDARIMDSDFHETGSGPQRQKLSVENAAPVTVGDGARIAGRSMVLKGAKVGARACVRPGAVLLREAPDGSTVSGFPARLEQPAKPAEARLPAQPLKTPAE